eukprot:s3677_g5.t1
MKPNLGQITRAYNFIEALRYGASSSIGFSPNVDMVAHELGRGEAFPFDASNSDERKHGNSITAVESSGWGGGLEFEVTAMKPTTKRTTRQALLCPKPGCLLLKKHLPKKKRGCRAPLVPRSWWSELPSWIALHAERGPVRKCWEGHRMVQDTQEHRALPGKVVSSSEKDGRRHGRCNRCYEQPPAGSPIWDADPARVRSARVLLLVGALAGFLGACCIGLVATVVGRFFTGGGNAKLMTPEAVVLSLPIMRAPAPHPLAGRNRQHVHERFMNRYMRLAQKATFPAEIDIKNEDDVIFYGTPAASMESTACSANLWVPSEECINCDSMKSGQHGSVALEPRKAGHFWYKTAGILRNADGLGAI